MVFDGNTERKTEHTIWKSIKNWAENWCQIVCGILFDLICCMTSSVKLVSMLLTWCLLQIRYNGSTFMVWDVGGQDKLRPLWRSYTRCTDGIIFVVDSSREESLEEAKLELQNICKAGPNGVASGRVTNSLYSRLYFFTTWLGVFTYFIFTKMSNLTRVKFQ